MIGCSRHGSELCGSLEIAGARSVGRAIGGLVAAASDLWLIEEPGALGPLAGARLGGLADPRIGDSALASALERISAPEAAAGASPLGDRRAATLPRRPEGPRDPVRTSARRRAPTATRPLGPLAPAVSPSLGTLEGPGLAVPGSGNGPEIPPPALPWVHLGAAAAVDLDRPDVARPSLTVLAGSGAAADRFEPGLPGDPSDDRGFVPGTSVPLDRRRSAPAPGSTPVTGARSPRGLHEEPDDPGRTPELPAGNGLAALVHLWAREDASATGSAPTASPSAEVARSAAPDPADKASELAAGSTATAPRIARRLDPAPGELPGDDGAVTDLEAEALVLELLERALRGEARRHGVALGTGGLV